ncbi:antA/AntB antirepressor family protein [Sporosarcina sp. FSL K6-3457]|uniref:antA/AntB antirepressor family protein n=1 Tax=Sporosarcina sp. FSL K6-3457 TaxID=2978204 RepID=UPI0030F90DAC
MDQLITTSQNGNGEILVSGRDLYSFLEVTERYNSWFERMLQYGFIEDADFASVKSFTVVNNGAKREIDDHNMKLDMAKEIAMIQRSEKGKQARQYFLHLERMWNSPEMVIKRAMDFQQQKIMQLQNEIQANKRYTDFGKIVETSEAAVSIGSFVKTIYDNHGINIGRNKLFDWLREKGYLIKEGREKNNPKQQYLMQGLFEVRPTIVKRTEGDVQTHTTLITGKGQVKIAEMLLKDLGS